MQTSPPSQRERASNQRGILQIHPTAQCNLFCRHCYSNSGPAANLRLEPIVLLDALEDASRLGYGVLSVSGGEPLLYDGLTALLERAHDLGMFTQIATNGTLFSKDRLRVMRKHLDLVAVSLDGTPELHNEIRGSPRAFDRLQKGLEALKEEGMPFGIIHTLTRRSWPRLFELAEFAYAQGAALFQIHPLERTGRAALQMPGDALTVDELLRTYVLSLALASKYEGMMSVQFDALERESFLRNAGWAYASEWGDSDGPRIGPEVLRIIVVETDGAVVPLSYGMSRELAVCDLGEERLREAWPRFMQRRYPLFRALCRNLYHEIACSPDLAILNWHEMMVARSHRPRLGTFPGDVPLLGTA